MTIEMVTIIALFAGPIAAVVITLLYQTAKEDRATKLQLFSALMANRQVLTPDWVKGLNLIDVFFHKDDKVLAKWHEYYALVLGGPSESRNDELKKTSKALLAEMAKVLRYKNLDQNALEKFYVPQAHATQVEVEARIQNEWLRVLENTDRFLVDIRERQTESQG